MQVQSYLMFRHRDLLYGIPAHQVRELFPLPALTLLADAPQDIMGSLNWRGKLLPVMHLDLRLGQPIMPCQLTDSVVVIEWQGIQVGMVVNQVLGVHPLEASIAETALNYGREQQINTAFLSGIATQGTETVMLLKSETLIRQPDAVATQIWEAELFGPSADDTEVDGDVKINLGQETATAHATVTPDIQAEWQQYVSAKRVLTNFFDLYCPHASAVERAILQQRAKDLSIPLEDTDVSERLPLAIVGWGDELFGIDLSLVREFINIKQVTSIPCCPPHILGNMNLRGEIMTLVNICNFLNLPTTDLDSQRQAIVVDIDDKVVGIPVDVVLDIAYFSSMEISMISDTLLQNRKGYLQGTTKYQDIPLNILDLSEMFNDGILMVDHVEYVSKN